MKYRYVNQLLHCTLFLVVVSCPGTTLLAQVSTDSLLSKAGYFYSRDQFDSSEYYYTSVYLEEDRESKIKGLTGIIKVNIFKNAFDKIDSLLHIGNKLIADMPYSKAVCNYNIMKGEYFRKASRYSEALELHKQTVIQSATLQDAKVLEADALLYTALTYERMASYDSSLVYADRAYAIFKVETDITAVRFSSIANSLGVCYYRSNQIDKAKSFYLQAKNIAEDHLGPTSSDLAYALGNLASIESDAQQYSEAIKYTTQALKINKALKDEDGMSTSYYSLGVYYYYLGDYGRAKDYLEACIEIRERILHPLHARLIWPYQVLGIALQESGDDRQTIKYNHKSRQILIANYGPGSLEEGFLYENMATAYLNSGQPDSALIYIEKASKIVLNTLPQDDYSLAIHYFSLANIHYMASNYENAKQYIQKSSQVLELIGATTLSDYAQNLALQALIESYLGNDHIADSLFEASLSLIKNEEDFEFSSNAFWILGSYTGYQYDKYQRTKQPTSLKEYNDYAETYLNLSNKYRKQFNDPFTKSAIIRNNVRVYNENIGNYTQLYKETKDRSFMESAYAFSEYGRTAILRDMQDGKIQHYSGVADSILLKEVELQKEITALNQQYLEYPDSAVIKKSLFEAKESLNNHIEALLISNPQYYELKFNAKILSLEEVSKKLKLNENLIAYMRDDTAYYALLTNHSTTDLFYLGNKAVIDQLVVAWRQLITTQDFKKTTANCFELYTYLFQPFENKLNGDRIIIVPNGPLFYLNFETLSRTDDERTFLIYDYNISYAFSINLHYGEAVQRPKKQNGFAIAIAPGFEDEIKQAYTQALDTMEFVDDSYLHTVRQPWSVKLADKLKKAYRNNAFIGMKATESNIKSNLHKGNVLYFGTHAITNGTDPMRSKLVLAKEIGEQKEDGYLHAYELYGLTLNADLAVLNACESGIGSLQEGEGMISLAYSLNFAGCPSTLMSLWRVDEKTSTKITNLFFDYLAGGASKSEALRNAKLAFLEGADESQKHPYYWSGMVLMGKDGQVSFRKKIPTSLIFVGISLLIIGFLFWFGFRKRA